MKGSFGENNLDSRILTVSVNQHLGILTQLLKITEMALPHLNVTAAFLHLTFEVSTESFFLSDFPTVIFLLSSSHLSFLPHCVELAQESLAAVVLVLEDHVVLPNLQTG